MLNDDFMKAIEDQLEISKDILLSKNSGYAKGDTDRLHTFNRAAALKGITPREALSGMMLKHTISVYDLCADEDPHSLDVWTEKITDHINYLLLLKAVIIEEIMESGKDDLWNNKPTVNIINNSFPPDNIPLIFRGGSDTI